MMLFLTILAGTALLFFLGCYSGFRFCFYSPRGKAAPTEVALPSTPLYEPYREPLKQWAAEVAAIPREDVEITSFDGLKLHGYFFEFAPGAPVEIMFHGYRGNALVDLPCGILRAFRVRRSVLLVDQRGAGKSEGNVITFGIRESRDCIRWAEYAAQRFPDRKIILTGISMGASTVMMAADKDLPANVVGILADCGYTSPKEIMIAVARQRKLPGKFLYPFIRLGAKLFGGFDPEEDSPLQAVKGSRLPIIFFHGEDDDYVPCYMSRENYEACTARKFLATYPGAGHVLCYPADPERYIKELTDFFGEEMSHPISQ